ncbi:phage tail tape measure protein [Marinomonas transparens]|uniref:Phage tail tape measure protein n=1 Tax=Marinomonas transparens TaxID=2795388 RepID=A0A934JXI3_9GAMM|nr:phage tail tape measure protein [Marinomonas transparens]MBJ7540032.1 phage tail tape measure protein [Marinomonas transparens]
MEKISIGLTAVSKFAKPFNEAIQTVGKFESEIEQTSASLKKMGDQQKLVTRFKTLNGRLEETRQSMSQATQETNRLKQAEISAKAVVKQHTTELAKAEKAVLESAQAYGIESNEVATASLKVKQLTKAKKAADLAYKKEKAALKNSQTASVRLTASYSKQSKELGGLRHDMSSAGLKLNSLGAQELKLAKQTDKATKALDKQKAKLKSIQTIKGRIADRNAQKGELVGQAVGAAATAAPLILAGKRSVEYENTFADVKKVVNFSDKKEEAQYRTKMMKLAGRLGVQQEGIADIVTAAGQSGIEKRQLLEFAESATKMSVAWDVSAEEAGSTLATWRAAMGLTQKNALDLADATNYLSNNMNAKAKDIAGVMVREGSTAMGAGLGANEVAALAASLIAGGATEDTAATALKNISGALTSGYAATGSQKTALSKIGFDAEELASSMQQDAKGTLLGVLRELQEVSADERGAVISQLFGSEIKGAVSKLVGTLDDPQNGLVSAFSKVANQADRANSVNDEYVNRAATRSHSLSQLGAKFDRMTIVLGDRLLPVLDSVLPPLMSVVDSVADFAEANPDLASGLLGVAAAIAVVKAGAIAFKLAKLTMGNGADRFKLGKTKLTRSTDHTVLSADRASRSVDRLNRKLNGLGAGAGRGGGGMRGRNRLAGLSSIEDRLYERGQPSAGAAKKGRFGKFGRLGGVLGRGAGRAFGPLSAALQVGALVSAISDGGASEIGATSGSMAGGMGGAMAGGMAGAAIGSVVPVIGTAIGGLVGSIAGGMGGGSLGEWMGEKIGGWFGEDKTEQPAPSAIAEQTKQLQQGNKAVNFAPVIHLTPSGNPAYDQEVSNQVIDRLKAEFGPAMMGSMDVATRSDASLSDKRNS